MWPCHTLQDFHLPSQVMWLCHTLGDFYIFYCGLELTSKNLVNGELHKHLLFSLSQYLMNKLHDFWWKEQAVKNEEMYSCCSFPSLSRWGECCGQVFGLPPTLLSPAAEGLPSGQESGCFHSNWPLEDSSLCQQLPQLLGYCSMTLPRKFFVSVTPVWRLLGSSVWHWFEYLPGSLVL